MLGAHNGSLAMYLADPRRPIETSEEILQRLIGLTAREASVLGTLVRGYEPGTIAETLGISQDTVRDHLKNVMQTMGTNRQADLVRVVLSSAAWVAGGKPG
jgi:FixJ family two-component response regulator